MSFIKAEASTVTLTGHLLDSISEVMLLVESTEIEHENFMEVGCYLYRASPIIMELHIPENITQSMTDILLSLSANVDRAKQLARIFSNGTKPVMNTNLKSIIEQLEGTLNSIGCDLSSIPSSAFKNNYIEFVVKSLSRDMRNVRLQIKITQPYEMVEYQKENILTEIIKEGEGKRAVAPMRHKSRRSSSHRSDMPRLVDFLKGVYYGSQENEIQSLAALTNVAEYIEPLYDTFFCPLTKKIMEDPVTIESGVTYERSAINEWFEKNNHEEKAPICPTTGMKMHNKTLSTNLALKTTIKEWAERNETARLRVAHKALLLALSEAMVLDAVRDLQVLCRREYNRKHVHNVGITELLTKFLEYNDRKVRSETLGLLHLLAEDDQGKEIIVKTEAIAAAVKMLSSYNSSERKASISFLLELSNSKVLCENIGAATGGIFMLITMKNKSDDPLVAEEAGTTLKNLEKCPKNIKCMAENGFLQPLLNHLIEGSEEVQTEMATYLNELVLKFDIETCVTKKMSKDLIQIANGNTSLIRGASLKALVLISSYETNNKTLIDAGIIQFTIEKMFTRKIHNESMYSIEDLATILGNILRSKVDPESIQVNKHGHTMASDYFICNVIDMIRYNMPLELNMNLIKVLTYLSNIQKAFSRIVSIIKETKSIQIIILLLNSQHDELVIATTELLIKLSSHIGHAIAEELCKTQGQPEDLIGRLDFNQIDINKKHVMYLSLLTKLPHHNLTLNQALLHKGTVPIIIERINKIQRGEAMTRSWSRSYLEGLVGTLVRFTSTLYAEDILHMTRQQNLTSILNGLLQSNAGSEEVQRLAALGLEKLSAESINLAIKHPEMTKPRKRNNFTFKCFSMKQKVVGGYAKVKVQVCPVHRGECSSSNNFCLLEAKAIQGLVSCLESENDGVVEAALGAISTLLDERVDLERSVRELSEVDAVTKVMRVLREHQEGSIWEKTLWVIDRFLIGGGQQLVNDIYKERLLPKALVSAFHHEDGKIREVAERIMRKLNQMQTF